ncbi:MAG: lactate racemase domain-containing protein [Anaerolineales bacterium]
MIGLDSPYQPLADEEIQIVVAEAFTQCPVDGLRVLVIIPDTTRTAPIPLFFRLINEAIGDRARKLDYLVALGTHQPLSEAGIAQLVGMSAEERARRFPNVNIYNHRWDLPGTFTSLGTIPASEIASITNGMLVQDVDVALNKMIFDYDILIICGPVFPHEVVGFSGGNKYFFPGIGGPSVINFSHWLGALITSMEIIGREDTPVRRVIDRAASMIPLPKFCFSIVVHDDGVAGVYFGTPEESQRLATELAADLHITYVDRPYRRVLSVIPPMYDDLWTAAKGMYKTEPVIADGGEVIIYAPHIHEISYTHGKILDEIGYHVRDYFTKQWDRFKGYPWGVLAHSTHLRGIGTYENGVERPRIQVTLATGIPEERCKRVNLGYMDPASIRISEWEGREDEGILVVHKAGETLYRLKDESKHT